MKYTVAICFLLFMTQYSPGQTTIADIKVYNHWSRYDSDSGSWSPWKANDEVFILNYKDERKIARCRLDSKIIILNMKEHEPIEEGNTADGYSYTLVQATGDFFQPYELRFFEGHPDYGLELTSGTVRIRFAKK